MPYYINHTNGTSLVTVQDGATDNSATSITLVGKNFPTYGQILNQNLVTMLESSSSISAPSPALLGQLWYDSANKTLSFYREGSTSSHWQKLAMTYEGATAPNSPRLGDLWWDSSNSQLKLYNTTTAQWVTIGPQTTSNGQLRVIGNNSFDLQVGGNNVLKVDQYGGVNLPYNPCVYGYDNTSVVDLTTSGITSYNTWVPNTAIDKGSNFNISSGVFTVATTGIYRVQAEVTTLGGVNTAGQNEIRLRWNLNSGDINVNSTNNHTNVATHQLSCNGIIYAREGDTINLVFSTAVGASISKSNSSYSIQLVG